MRKVVLSQEALCAFYLSMFSLLSPITNALESGSTLVLALALAIVLALQIIMKSKHHIKSDYSFLIRVSALVVALFTFDMLLRPNQHVGSYLYTFILYGFFPLYFLSSISNYDRFIKCYCFMSILCGLMVMADPLKGYVWTGDYMFFGFNFMLPAFAASVILFFHYRHKIALILVAVFFMMLLIFANKGSILTALVLLLVAISYINNGYRLSLKVIFAFALVLLILNYTYMDLLDFAISITDSLGISTYSLNTIQIILSDTSDNEVYNVRLFLWQDAMQLFSDSPLIGHGIGYYESRFGKYEHNLFLEILDAWGIFGMSLLVFFVLRSLLGLMKTNIKELKLLIVVFAVLSFVSLMSSKSLWIHPPFWLFFYFALHAVRKSTTRNNYKRIKPQPEFRVL